MLLSEASLCFQLLILAAMGTGPKLHGTQARGMVLVALAYTMVLCTTAEVLVNRSSHVSTWTCPFESLNTNHLCCGQDVMLGQSMFLWPQKEENLELTLLTRLYSSL